MVTDKNPHETEGRGRSAEKHRAILDAARRAFLVDGYDATSMDDIALSASVSKPTIYNHFHDKAGLFRAAVVAAIDETEAATHDMVVALPKTHDVEGDLGRFARQHLAHLMKPELIRARRRMIAELERFPELAATWYECGPAAGIATLASVFSELGERGLLSIDYPNEAAEHFNWLVLIPLNRAMFIDEQPTPDELDHAADAAVRVFLAAYAPGQDD